MIKADENGIWVIEDAAQAIGAFDKETKAGTLGDIGCFSFTQGKHFSCGEGGFIVTKNPDLYMKCALIRNHAEAVISSAPTNVDFSPPMFSLVGMNLRMTELQAVVLIEQLKYIDDEIYRRNKIVDRFQQGIEEVKCIEIAKTKPGYMHAYYVLAFHYFKEWANNIPREKFMDAVNAEIKIKEPMMSLQSEFCRGGYIDPLYKMPLFKGRNIPSCPVTEAFQNDQFCLTLFQKYNLTVSQIDLIVEAFKKVWENRKELI
jgi:perosamine synthetase